MKQIIVVDLKACLPFTLPNAELLKAQATKAFNKAQLFNFMTFLSQRMTHPCTYVEALHCILSALGRICLITQMG